jgi:hypothetical protein
MTEEGEAVMSVSGKRDGAGVWELRGRAAAQLEPQIFIRCCPYHKEQVHTRAPRALGAAKKSKLRAVFLAWLADELPLDLAHPS